MYVYMCLYILHMFSVAEASLWGSFIFTLARISFLYQISYCFLGLEFLHV